MQLIQHTPSISRDFRQFISYLIVKSVYPIDSLDHR